MLPGNDNGFVIFVDDLFGIRAIVKILKSYKQRGLVTIRQIVSTWAPPADHNDTEAYITNVCKRVGKADTVPMTQDDYPVLLQGIITQENGSCPYSLPVINTAIRMANNG